MKQTKKLMVVAPYFYPKIGGLENYAYNIAKGLKQKHGWEIVIVTSNHEHPRQYKEETLEGMKVYRLPRWFKVSNTPINPLWYWQIKRIIRKENPDIINAHSPVPFIADMAAKVAGKIPFVLTYHATEIYEKNKFVKNSLIFLYERLLGRNTFNRADLITTVSDYVKNYLEKKHSKPVKVIYNSISKKDILRKNPKKEYELIFLGSLDRSHSWKGLNEIIVALDIYKKMTHNKSITLKIVGDGDYKKKYLDLVNSLNLNENVRFCGFKSGKEKNELIQKAKILVSYAKTLGDAFPTVFLEAWANKTVLIASDIGSTPYIINREFNGLLVKPNNPQDLAIALKDILNNEKKQNRLVTNGSTQLKNFNWDVQTSHFNHLLNKIK